jgi:hypothetical protein
MKANNYGLFGSSFDGKPILHPLEDHGWEDCFIKGPQCKYNPENDQFGPYYFNPE